MAEAGRIRRVVVLMSVFTGEVTAYTDRHPECDEVVRLSLRDGDYTVLYDGPPKRQRKRMQTGQADSH